MQMIIYGTDKKIFFHTFSISTTTVRRIGLETVV